MQWGKSPISGAQNQPKSRFLEISLESLLLNAPKALKKTMVISLLTILALLSTLLVAWQWFAAWRFPLHSTIADSAFTPPVTLLKPIKGWDPQTATCLQSWLQQSYPAAVQVLFGIASPDDPAVGHIRRLIQENPAVNAK